MATFSDEQMEQSISGMLRFGVSLSALVIAFGGFLYLQANRGGTPAYSVFHPELSSLRSLTGTLQGTARLDPASVIQLGMLLLIATPVARVAFCIFGFARQRDRLYTAISSAVLLILIYSLVQGGR